MAAGIIWILVALACNAVGDKESAHIGILKNLTEYAELFLFLLCAMTYINSLEERNVFQSLRAFLVSRGFSLRTIFWLTGLLAFFISPIADNLTTALLMGAVVIAVGQKNQKFIAISCINIVIAANAGGAFSPFGDITTLMVWQKGKVQFFEFFKIFIPSVVNWLFPAFIMSFCIDKETPAAMEEEVRMKFGAIIMMVLFLITIATAVSFHNFLHLPAAAGMMLGLGFLGMYSWRLKIHEGRLNEIDPVLGVENHHESADHMSETGNKVPFDIMKNVGKAEWDTLLFFYGVILCVGGLAQFGYLALISKFLYADLGPTMANSMIGVLSAVVDNIPVMFAVLTMDPSMPLSQWLLVTLTAGVGGSLLSIGSAAGVGLMGTARGVYTFGSHLKWTPVIAIGYVLSIWIHILINGQI